MKFRKSIINAGRFKHIKVYPVTNNGRQRQRRAKSKASRPCQSELNRRNRATELSYLIEENAEHFTKLYTLSYPKESRPNDFEVLKKDWANFLKRLKSNLKKLGIPSFHWVKALELAGADNYHIHLLCALPVKVVRAAWLYPGMVHAENFSLSPQSGGTDIAHYFYGEKGVHSNHKQPCKRAVTHSRGLKKPDIEVVEISRAKVEKLLRNGEWENGEMWKGKEEGYNFVSAMPVFNEFFCCFGLSATLYQIAPCFVRRKSITALYNAAAANQHTHSQRLRV